MQQPPSTPILFRVKSWGPLLLLWGLVVALLFSGKNQALFLSLNGAHDPALWSGLTVMGDTAVALSLMLLFCGRAPRLVSALFISIIPGTILVHGAKALFDIARPAAVLASDQMQIIGPELTRHAFPSGHTATAFIAIGLIILHYRTRLGFLLGFSVALLIGLSRVMVGAHWPLDVLAGAGIGWLTAILSLSLADLWEGGLSWTAQRIFTLLLFITALYTLVMHDTHYPDGLWMQIAVPLLAIAFSLPGIKRLLSSEERG